MRREGKPLDRYFPELREPLLRQLPKQCVLDGEIVIARGGGLDFDALTLRIHPAASRVKTLAAQLPASVVFFDLLQVESRDLRDEPFGVRRAELERILANVQAPLPYDAGNAGSCNCAGLVHTLRRRGLGRRDRQGCRGAVYVGQTHHAEDQARTRLRLCVGGFRWHKDGDGTRSVRCCWASTTTQANCSMLESASFTAAKRKELVKLLAPYREEALRDHPWADWADDAAQANGRMPGGQSRWNSGKDLSWQPLRIELVVEVAYEHMQGDPLSPLRAFPAVAP